MKCLVYCILRCGQPLDGGLPIGIDGEPVRLAADEGLAAAFSLVAEREAAPSVERATAFAHVVDAFHNAGTVLPLRYGCLLDTPGQVAQFLHDRRAEFLAALSRLDGCVEMGLRILLPVPLPPGEGRVRGVEAGAELPLRPSPPPSPEGRGGGQGSGRDYLARRGAYYAAKDGADRQAADIAALARAAFEGLFSEVRLEPPSAGRMGVLSLCFLIRREGLAAFHAAFAQFEAQCRQRVMLTGPWPPYSFAGPEDAQVHAVGPAGRGPRRTCGAVPIEGAQENAGPTGSGLGWPGAASSSPAKGNRKGGLPQFSGTTLAVAGNDRL